MSTFQFQSVQLSWKLDYSDSMDEVSLIHLGNMREKFIFFPTVFIKQIYFGCQIASQPFSNAFGHTKVLAKVQSGFTNWVLGYFFFLRILSERD